MLLTDVTHASAQVTGLCYVKAHYISLSYVCVLQVLKQRPDLKLVVMSATLEAEKFQGYFLDAPLMKASLSRAHWLAPSDATVPEACVWPDEKQLHTRSDRHWMRAVAPASDQD